MKKIGIFAITFFLCLDVFCTLPVNSTTRYVETRFGRLLEISTSLTNKRNKTITSIHFSVIFKNKLYDPSDWTAPFKIVSKEEKVHILPSQATTVKILVSPPSDTNMIFNGLSIERIIHNDGTYKDY